LNGTQWMVDALWVMLCAVLVIFMQAGFVLLEAGATRMKNAGHIAVKQVIGLSVAALAFWAVGYAFLTGKGTWIGLDGWFLDIPAEKGSLPVEVVFLFQLSFLAASLAVAWGGFAERAKAGVYLLFAAFYSTVVYPVAGHWIWSAEGWLHELGKQDFAGSTVVHVQGGIAALVATWLIGPRKGRFGPDGTPRGIPGHNQVFVVLGAMIIWLGWLGFNPGSTMTVGDGFFGYVALTTQLAAVSGALAAMAVSWKKTGSIEISGVINGLLAGLVAITAGCAFVEPWAAVVIGAVAGCLVVWSVSWIEKRGIDDPVDAFSVHGVAGIWGSLSTGLFASPRLVEKVGIGKAGLLYGGGFGQILVQTLGLLVCIGYVGLCTWGFLRLVRFLHGLRVTEEEEKRGLDLSIHGMASGEEWAEPEPRSKESARERVMVASRG
jgi:ammonium transporter, Amt family